MLQAKQEQDESFMNSQDFSDPWKTQEEQKKFDEQNREAKRQRTAANSVAVIIVGVPLFAYHWRIIKKDQQANGV